MPSSDLGRHYAQRWHKSYIQRKTQHKIKINKSLKKYIQQLRLAVQAYISNTGKVGGKKKTKASLSYTARLIWKKKIENSQTKKQ